MINTKRRTMDKCENLNIRVNAILKNHLETLSKATGMKKAEVVRLALFEKYLDHLAQTA